MATPLVLQQFVEADRATVRGWNGLWDFEGTETSAGGVKHEARLDKSRMLRVVLAMESLRVLPSDGIPRKELVDLPLSQIAPAAGYKHASSYARVARRCREMITSSGAYGSPSHREWAFSESDRVRKKNGPWKGHNLPSARELKNHPTLGPHFRNATGGGGYGQRMGFIYHPNFPGTPNDRTVLSALCKLGIFGDGGKGKEKGVLDDTTQIEIAGMTGLCCDTVRSILHKYSVYTVRPRDPLTGKLSRERIEQRGEFPIFRIVCLGGHWEKSGQPLDHHEAGASWKQPPNKIIYLGDRMLDERTGLLETQRLQALAKAQQMTAELWWKHVARVHGTLLRRWIGTERHVVTFWHACRMELIDGGCGVPAHLLDTLFPEWRAPS
jgi:hypothetical protein